MEFKQVDVERLEKELNGKYIRSKEEEKKFEKLIFLTSLHYGPLKTQYLNFGH